MDNFGVRYNNSYSFILRPRRTGKITIGQAKITVDGNRYTSQPLEITVIEQSEAPAAQGGNKEVFATVELSQSSPFVGEAVTVSYKLYFSTSINQPQPLGEPDFSSFLKEEIELKNIPQRNEMIDGKEYRMALLRQFIIVPQRAGTFQPGAFELQVPMYQTTDQRDVFGRRMQRMVNELVVAKVPTLRVKALPEEGKPPGFGGAVGQFQVTAGPNRTTTPANESVMYRIKVSGKGNLRTVALPEVQFPPVLEAYDPRYKEDIQINASGISGYKQNEYILIPRSGGQYKLPGGSFSWFDPKLQRYQTYTWKDTTLVVEGAAAAGTSAPGGENQAVQTLADDIRFITTNPPQPGVPGWFWGSKWMVLALVIPLLGWPLAWWGPLLVRKKEGAQHRRTQALKSWSKSADQADADQLPLLILQSLTEAAGWFLNLEPAQVDAPSLQKGFGPLMGSTHAEALAKLWTQAEAARYGGLRPEDLRTPWKSTLKNLASCA
jgi:hypothetical protein